MKSKFISSIALLAASLVVASASDLARLSARQMLDKAGEFEASALMIQRVDTSEQAMVATVGQQRTPQPPQTNVVTIEIDRARLLARQSCVIEGKKIVLLRQGDKSAMRTGNSPWEIPRGIYANIAKELGNLFVCEQETPESAQNAPVWIVTGSEQLDGVDAYVIETEGNSAAPLARARMLKGMAKTLPPGSVPPSVKVLCYSSKHWVGKSDFRPLRTVQSSKYEVTMTLPGGQKPVVETTSVSKSEYQYETVDIAVPSEAQRILAAHR
jgi:hypothetical protein